MGDSSRGSGGFCRARAALEGSGRQTYPSAGTSTVGGDAEGKTSDKCPQREKHVVNLYTHLVCTNIA